MSTRKGHHSVTGSQGLQSDPIEKRGNQSQPLKAEIAGGTAPSVTPDSLFTARNGNIELTRTSDCLSFPQFHVLVGQYYCYTVVRMALLTGVGTLIWKSLQHI